jgi:hypothetical protein
LRSIVFNVRSGLDTAGRDQLLRHLESWPEIDRAAPLRPGAKSDSVSRMFFAYVSDGADVHRVVQQIEARPEVESASVPAQRGVAAF